MLYPFDRGTGTVGASLVFDNSGNIYGVRTVGTQDYGETFKLTQQDGSWNYTMLHAFTGGDQGASPYGGVVMDAAGNLWGTASAGGAHNYGLGLRDYAVTKSRHFCCGRHSNYSARNVIEGSTCAARHAGIQQAMAETATSNAITPR